MRPRSLLAAVLLSGIASALAESVRPERDDLSRVPLNRLQLGPTGIERKPTPKARFTRGPGRKGKR